MFLLDSTHGVMQRHHPPPGQGHVHVHRHLHVGVGLIHDLVSASTVVPITVSTCMNQLNELVRATGSGRFRPSSDARKERPVGRR